MTKQDLSDLLVRVEGARGPNFALEEEIDRVVGKSGLVVPPAYTASLEAALALVTRVLGPDPWFAVERQNEPGGPGLFFGSCATAGHTFAEKGYWPPTAYAPTPSLALLAAMLKALIEDGER